MPRLRQLAASVLLCLLFLVRTAGPSWAQSSAEQQIEAQVYQLTNQFRAQHGLQQLRLDRRLIDCARAHSAEMIRLNYFSHRSPTVGYITVADRARAAGVNDLACGENLASMRGYAPSQLADAAMRGWIASPGHLANLMRPSYNSIGVGVVIRGNQCMITQNFGEPLLAYNASTGTWSPASTTSSNPPPVPTRPVPSRPRSPAAVGTRQIEDQIVALTNQARSQAGLGELRSDDRLRQAAIDHDAEMIALNYFSHESPTEGRTTVADRVRLYGVTDMTVTENIAQMRGYAPSTLAQAAITGFMGSEGQRENILQPDFTRVGVGVVMAGDRAMVCEVFGQPSVPGWRAPTSRLGKAWDRWMAALERFVWPGVGWLKAELRRTT